MTSPRRLTKQSALESPTNDLHSTIVNAVKKPPPKNDRHFNANADATNRRDDQYLNQRQRLRKMGPFAVDSQSVPDSRVKYAGSWPPPSYESDTEGQATNGPSGMNGQKQPPVYNREDVICERCTDCGAAIEEYNDEEIGIMITILNTFIHREPALAASFLPEILLIVSKYSQFDLKS